MNVEEKAAIITHEANRSWCELHGDRSQKPWDEAPEWQRQSARSGVKFHIYNPDAGDAASHNNWMQEKLDAGWVYGVEKNPDTYPPTHPCLVPFDDLPDFQKVKDALFRAIVHAVIGGGK